MTNPEIHDLDKWAVTAQRALHLPPSRSEGGPIMQWIPRHLVPARRLRRQMREHLTEMAGLPLVIDLRDVTCSQCGDQERQKTVVLDGEAVCVDRASCQGSHGSVAAQPR